MKKVNFASILFASTVVSNMSVSMWWTGVCWSARTSLDMCVIDGICVSWWTVSSDNIFSVIWSFWILKSDFHNQICLMSINLGIWKSLESSNDQIREPDSTYVLWSSKSVEWNDRIRKVQGHQLHHHNCLLQSKYYQHNRPYSNHQSRVATFLRLKMHIIQLLYRLEKGWSIRWKVNGLSETERCFDETLASPLLTSKEKYSPISICSAIVFVMQPSPNPQ